MAYPMARRAWAGVAVTMHQLSSAVSPYSARPYGTKVVSYSPADAAKSGRKVYDLRSDTGRDMVPERMDRFSPQLKFSLNTVAMGHSHNSA